MQPELKFITTPEQHQIAYALIGDPARTPMLFLHGGPGANCHAADAQKFNLERHCVVMFDQRGCGRSTPAGDIHHNTTQHLISDIEQLRQVLSIRRWIVYGGSWGAALALEYAKQYPAQVIAIILRGSFAARQQDLDWFIEPDGVAAQYPGAYQQLVRQLNPHPGEALSSRLYAILRSPPNDTLRKRLFGTSQSYQAALAWDHWEATVMGTPKPTAETNLQQQEKRIAAKLIYAHYCHHQFFIGEQGVLNGLGALRDIPVTLIHGRHDQVCPLNTAEALDAALPDSKLIVVDAGHGLHETEMTRALWQLVS